MTKFHCTCEFMLSIVVNHALGRLIMGAIDWIKNLENYVPLFQTLVWAVLLVVGVRLFRVQVRNLLDALVERVKTSTIKIAGLLVIEELSGLKRIEEPSRLGDALVEGKDSPSVEARIKNRQEIYDRNRNVCIVHVLTPTRQPDMFEIYIYLIRHKPTDELPDDLSDIIKAEFFFGRYWKNHTFTGTRAGNRIGVRAQAYGAFLCTCRVEFQDGYHVMLDRYIDREMGDIVQSSANQR